MKKKVLCQDTMVYSIIFEVKKWELNTFVNNIVIVHQDCSYGDKS